MASLVPARLLGLADRGRIAPGHRADLAVLDPDFRPRQTLVGGLRI
jgi:N-acetylglucosamine-6-phosphate deacetylase